MSKHTPGPWFIDIDQPYIFIRAKGQSRPITALVSRNADDNARLIAAAPEMLEALILALEELDGWPEELRERWKGYETGKRKWEIDDAQAVVDAIRAAISKAKGKGRGQ